MRKKKARINNAIGWIGNGRLKVRGSNRTKRLRKKKVTSFSTKGLACVSLFTD